MTRATVLTLVLALVAAGMMAAIAARDRDPLAGGLAVLLVAMIAVVIASGRGDK